MIDYQTFLDRKKQLAAMSGFEPLFMPDVLFSFQRFLVDWALRKGRAAVFADCGLGKGPMSLVWAENVVRKTNRPVLILTPLAVSHQLVREAQKFGIEAHRSTDGKPAPNITVTNYERLDKFNPDDYSGVVCDEACFPAGTLIDTPCGSCSIEDIQPGEVVLNATGTGVVLKTHKVEVDSAVRITIEGSCVVATPNHLFFTQRGWVRASALRAGDHALETAAAVPLVREGVLPEVLGILQPEILRNQLLCEMEDEYPGAQGQGAYSGSRGEAREGEVSVVSRRVSRSGEGKGTYPVAQSDDESGSEEESQSRPPRHGVQANHSRRQRNRVDSSGTSPDNCARAILGTGNSVAGEENSGVSNLLQTGRSERLDHGWHRSGWIIAPRSEGAGPEEGRQTGFARVDCVEVLEQGHPELDRYRDASGKLYFHDLSVSRHPSYSVNGCLVHNSILKHWSGATQKEVTRFLSKLRYRLLCTATPSPNDFVEMGTLSEALGELTHSEMLAIFFRQLSDDEKKKRATPDDVIHSRRLSWRVIQSMGQWVLKPHAFEPFWKWVASWARACRKPSDLGPFDDSSFVLPPLNRRDHTVRSCKPPDGWLFTVPAFGLNQERAERRRTLDERSELVVDLTKDSDSAIVWCHLNPEGDRLEKAIRGAVQVKGSQSPDEKEELLLAFLNGQARVLVTKGKIAGLGLNLQHCAHVVTFVDHSWEKFYQCIRRCWRFGQKRSVTLDVIATEGEVNVRKNMDRKEKLANVMFNAVIEYMNDALAVSSNQHTLQAEVPSWLRSYNS